MDLPDAGPAVIRRRADVNPQDVQEAIDAMTPCSDRVTLDSTP